MLEKKVYEMPELKVFFIEEDVLLYSNYGADGSDEYVRPFDSTWLP